jgi:hypothetical protein
MGKKTLKRQALAKPNLSYFRWRYLRNAARTYRAWQHRDSYSKPAAQAASEIAERGIVVGPADRFLSLDGRKALSEASAIVMQLSQSEDVSKAIAGKIGKDGKDYLIRLVSWEEMHSPESPLIRVALDRALLETVATYLDMWPRLHAVGAWLNFPTQTDAKEAQLWHRDPEDLKTVKVFIYLDDVREENGPFCYVPRTHPFSSGAGIVPLHRDKKRILDEEMLTAFPKGSWLTCTGPANTMIIADTVGFHRGGKPSQGNRILITFTFTSGTPFVKRVLRISGKPSWIQHPIQRYAL